MSVYRHPDLATGQSAVLDAEQWGVLNIPRGGGEPNVVCAMPSPDAMAAAAASGAFNGNSGGEAGASGGGALGVGQSAASIGLRTQSIQLLRDAMYRMCEGYAAGAIDGLEYGVMMRRFQTQMVAILAIEQLTGVVAAGPAAVSASGDATAAEGEPDGQRPGPRPGHVVHQRTTASAEAGEAQLASTAEAVAQAVESITLAAMSHDYMDQMCFEVLRYPNQKDDSLRTGYCGPLLAADLAQRKQSADLIAGVVGAHQGGTSLSADELADLRALLAQMDHGWSSGDLRRPLAGPEE